MLSMLKRHEVEILLKAGHGKAEVARLTGLSLCSVKRIAQEGQWCMLMMRQSEPNDRSGGRARLKC
jgi:DNA invertase Pin-like site-specific DNA recombinase